MHHKTTILVAPALHNSSCTHPRYSQLSFFAALSPGDVVQALIVLFLTIGVLGANMLLILVINSRRYSKYIHSQVRHLTTIYNLLFFCFQNCELVTHLFKTFSIFLNTCLHSLLLNSYIQIFIIGHILRISILANIRTLDKYG